MKEEFFLLNSTHSTSKAGRLLGITTIYTSISFSVGATARCGLWPVKQYLSIFPYPSPTLSIFSLPALEDLFLNLIFMDPCIVL